MRETDGFGVDVAVEASGSYSAANLCAQLLAKRGTYVQLGLHHGSAGFDLQPVCAKEHRIVGAYAKINQDWHTAIQLVRDKKVDLAPLVDSVFPLEEYEATFSRAQRPVGFKVMFNPWKAR